MSEFNSKMPCKKAANTTPGQLAALLNRVLYSGDYRTVLEPGWLDERVERRRWVAEDVVYKGDDTIPDGMSKIEGRDSYFETEALLRAIRDFLECKSCEEVIPIQVGWQISSESYVATKTPLSQVIKENVLSQPNRGKGSRVWSRIRNKLASKGIWTWEQLQERWDDYLWLGEHCEVVICEAARKNGVTLCQSTKT